MRFGDFNDTMLARMFLERYHIRRAGSCPVYSREGEEWEWFGSEGEGNFAPLLALVQDFCVGLGAEAEAFGLTASQYDRVLIKLGSAAVQKRIAKLVSPQWGCWPEPSEEETKEILEWLRGRFFGQFEAPVGELVLHEPTYYKDTASPIYWRGKETGFRLYSEDVRYKSIEARGPIKYERIGPFTIYNDGFDLVEGEFETWAAALGALRDAINAWQGISNVVPLRA